MAGIYIHFPFCIKKCNYCDFYSSTNTALKQNYLAVLKKELQIRKNYLIDHPVETIYFGGGTPSLLDHEKIKEILDEINKLHKVVENAEITIEVNPDDVDKEYFEQLYAAGINRLSIGTQSFDDNILKFLGRRHDAKQVYESVNDACNAGFSNISIDLIYGIPGLNFELWQKTLEIAFNQPIKHLSAYHLSFEEGTPLYKLMKNGIISTVNEEESWKQFDFLHNYSNEKGFEHYEISNFALPGKYSRHNSNYWNNIPYLGVGPSAHSYSGHSREWNLSDTMKYIDTINKGEKFYEQEDLSPKDKFNDFVLTRLRTSEGIDIEYFIREFGEKYFQKIINTLQSYTPKYAIVIKSKIRLTTEGWFISDRIISDLMV